MLNSYVTGDTNIKINACSGGIYKTYKESWFEHLYLNSNKAEVLFKEYEDIHKYGYYTRQYENVVVLQMILTADKDYVIAELIKQEDFNKYFADKAKIEQ